MINDVENDNVPVVQVAPEAMVVFEDDGAVHPVGIATVTSEFVTKVVPLALKEKTN